MVEVAKICGTCAGASNAINIAIKLSDEGKKVYVYKEILHNKNVIDTLEKKGITCVDDLSLVENGVVVIRAHGEGKDTYDYLEKNNIEYYDATCRNVTRIHNLIEEKYKLGFSIIIIGKKNHPEVIGSNGWCSNKAYIVEKEEDIDNIEELNNDVFIICQTTFNKDNAIKYSDIIAKKYKDKNIQFENSICNASVAIQTSSIELAKTSDLMIVIGGKNSSNTKELYEVCSRYCDSYLISDIDELFKFLHENKNINSDTKIGITAGASTMRSEIEKYRDVILFYIDYIDVKNKCILEQNKYNNNIVSDIDNELLKDAYNELVRMNSDGKFIRAYLISLSYRMYGGCDDVYMALAIAYELFQTSILIHDDIIDLATLRRGKPTIPIHYKDKYDKHADNFADSQALCIGDLGFYLANKIIIDNYSNNSNFSKILNQYNAIVINTIHGEMIDVELPMINHRLKTIENHVLEIYKLKTSWYTVYGPYKLGMILSGYDNKDYDDIFMNIGIAFQIKDDIIGIFGESSNTGKSSNTDIIEAKQTILYSYINDYKKEYLNDLCKYYGKKDLTDDDIQNVKQIFIDSGSLYYSKCKEEELFDNCIIKIDTMDIDEKYKNILRGFVVYLQNRNR